MFYDRSIIIQIICFNSMYSFYVSVYLLKSFISLLNYWCVLSKIIINDDKWFQKQTEGNKKLITVLDSKRSNAINIGLTKLPPARTIKAAILKMDSTIINREGVEVRDCYCISISMISHNKGMLMCKAVFPLLSSNIQSACSSLDWVINCQSEFWLSSMPY